MSALDELRLLARAKSQKAAPNVPNYAIPKKQYSDATANGLTNCIIDFIRFSGLQAERICVQGRTIDTRKTYIDVTGRRKTIGNVRRIKASAQVGSADISATILGRSVKIEVKIGRDKQSSDQKQYQRDIEAAGGVYLLVKDFQQFFEWFTNQKKG